MFNWINLFSLTHKYLRVEAMICGISPNDTEDIRQNVFLHILKHQASVAKLSAAELENFIDRAVAGQSKRWKRHRLRFKPMENDQVPTVNETRQGELNEYGFANLKLDIAGMLRHLTSRQYVICRCFMEGHPTHQVQKIVRCSQATMTAELENIRRSVRTLHHD